MEIWGRKGQRFQCVVNVYMDNNTSIRKCKWVDGNWESDRLQSILLMWGE
jgi:hypothetical protein